MNYRVVLFLSVFVLALIPGSPPSRSGNFQPALSLVAIAEESGLDSGTVLQMAYSRAIGQDDMAYHFQLEGVHYKARNDVHNLNVVVSEDSIIIAVGNDTWQLFSDTPANEFTLENNRLTIHRDGYDEWYINGPIGLQQGFTLYEPSTISFDIGGTVSTMADAHSLKIGNLLTFSGLMSFDAYMQQVPVEFNLRDNRLTYVYNDANVTYPLTIDPWVQRAKLVASDAVLADYFGISVAVSSGIALVGAWGDDCGSGLDCGSVYVFVRSGGLWNQQAKLAATDAAAYDNFGMSLTMSGDTALIGAPNDDCSAGLDCGSAYVFTRNGSTWSQQAKLTASVANENVSFGGSVALWGDTALVSSDDDCLAGLDCGSAYVFTRNGSTWSQQAKLTASDADPGDWFGASFALSSNTAIVGAPDDDCLAGPNCGSAYVFTRNGGTWSQRAKLTASDAAVSDVFGSSLALLDDILFIGAYGDACATGTYCGSVYVFTGSGSSWTQQTKLTASDAHVADQFGASLAVSSGKVLIGARTSDCTAGFGCGSVYVFTGSGSSWTQQAKLTATDADAGDNFGHSVAISGDTVLIGAFGNDDNGESSGSAYIFELSSLVASAACNGPNLDVIISAGNGPFNITVSAGINTPVLGVGIGTTTINGPEKWDNLTVAETSGGSESINLGQFKCRTDERPTPLTPDHRTRTTDPYPLFSWTPISDANNYRVFLFDDKVAANRTVDIRQNSGGGTQLTLATALPTKRLFWRVRGRTNRVWGLWSVRYTLFVDPPLFTPALSGSTTVPEFHTSTPLLPPPNDRLDPMPQPPNSR